MKPFWTDSDGTTAWYRVHILEKNYSVKVTESPFDDDVQVIEVKLEWGGGNHPARKVSAGDEFDKVSAAFRAAKASAGT